MSEHITRAINEHHKKKARAYAALAELNRQYANNEIDKAAYEFHVFRQFGEHPHKTLTQMEMQSRALHNTKHVGGPRTVELGLLVVVFLGLIGLLLFANSFGTTGLTIFEDTHQEAGLVLTGSSTYAFNTSNTTTLKVSGVLEGGSAQLYAIAGGNKYLILDEDSTTLTGVWLDKSSYSLVSPITITVLPEDASYTLWLTREGAEKIPVSEPLSLNESGNYLLEALINKSGEVMKKSATFTVREDSDALLDIAADAPSLAFTDACVETCTLPGYSEIVLESAVAEGAELIIDTITINEPRTNGAPVQVADIPNIAVDGNATLDLSAYFADPDGDELVYDINNIVGVEEDITGETLTLTSAVAGTYTAIVYASDLDALVQSNEFTITVLGIEEPPVEENTSAENITDENTSGENATGNATEIINESIDDITNETSMNNTNKTIIAPEVTPAGSCDNPNVNLRPANCFADVLDKAFVDVVAPLNNKEQTRVGRVTRFGNLVIGGRVIEASTGSASNRDFKVGYSQRTDFTEEYVATAWIDSSNGDLHLRGQLHEESNYLQAPQFNSYTIRNENDIILAYFDTKTGDLYLKGNIVQLGKV